uniref:Uncharacterized protein n=1 Tax=viral metagenome TaxID=1070528 RepID=A0A6M3K6J7_9ZZZZ
MSMALAEKENNALATIGEFTPQNREVAALFKEEQQPVIEILPRIQIVHAAQMFQLPSDEMVKEVHAVLIHAQRVNAWWEFSFEDTGGGEPPNCSSRNAVKPDIPAGETRYTEDGTEISPQSDDCSKCPKNMYGSSEKEGSNGKACKNMFRLFFATEGIFTPVLLTVPPTSLKAVSEYISKLQCQGLYYQQGICKLTLEKKKSYSKLKMSLAEVMGPERIDQLRKLVALRDRYMPVMAGQPFTQDETASAEETL